MNEIFDVLDSYKNVESANHWIRREFCDYVLYNHKAVYGDQFFEYDNTEVNVIGILAVMLSESLICNEEQVEAFLIDYFKKNEHLIDGFIDDYEKLYEEQDEINGNALYVYEL